jgi:hypothetical protein
MRHRARTASARSAPGTVALAIPGLLSAAASRLVDLAVASAAVPRGCGAGASEQPPPPPHEPPLRMPLRSVSWSDGYTRLHGDGVDDLLRQCMQLRGAELPSPPGASERPLRASSASAAAAAAAAAAVGVGVDDHVVCARVDADADGDGNVDGGRARGDPATGSSESIPFPCTGHGS